MNLIEPCSPPMLRATIAHLHCNFWHEHLKTSSDIDDGRKATLRRGGGGIRVAKPVVRGGGGIRVAKPVSLKILLISLAPNLTLTKPDTAVSAHFKHEPVGVDLLVSFSQAGGACVRVPDPTAKQILFQMHSGVFSL